MINAVPPRVPPNRAGAPPVLRGRYYPRHQARVIEQGDLLVIEFVKAPEQAASRSAGRSQYPAIGPARRQRRFLSLVGPNAATLPLPTVLALCGGVSVSAVFVAHLLHVV